MNKLTVTLSSLCGIDDSCFLYTYILIVIVSNCILKMHCISDMQGMAMLEL